MYPALLEPFPGQVKSHKRQGSLFVQYCRQRKSTKSQAVGGGRWTGRQHGCSWGTSCSWLPAGTHQHNELGGVAISNATGGCVRGAHAAQLVLA